MPDDKRPHLKPRDIAEILRCDVAKPLLWIQRGELGAINISETPGKRPRWRIPWESWEAFQAARSNQPASPAPRPQRRRRRRDERIIEFFK